MRTEGSKITWRASASEERYVRGICRVSIMRCLRVFFADEGVSNSRTEDVGHNDRRLRIEGAEIEDR